MQRAKTRSPPPPSRRTGPFPPFPPPDRPVELFNAVARYRRRVSPCTSFNRTPHFSRRCITVSRSPAFCYATAALIHYSCAAETRRLQRECTRLGVAKIRRFGAPPVLVPPFNTRPPPSLTNGLCLRHCKDKNTARERLFVRKYRSTLSCWSFRKLDIN